MSLSISNTGLTLIKKFEGCRLTAYQDSVGIWTIGYGHTSGVKSGQTITQAQADAYLKKDCSSAEKSVNSYHSKYNWNQNQFDALVSFTFNCGSGNLKTLLQNGTRTVAQISAMITAYNKAGGVVLQGLVNRRIAEKELFDRPISLDSISETTPICYLQTDTRWKNNNYSANGESKTIGSSGCAVTAAAMVIATLKDKNITPASTAEWSMAHGYKALNQGTYYTYFVPQFSVYGIECKRLNSSNLYGHSSSAAHTEALEALKNGNWVIACMGKGNWTSSGHFILLYRYEKGYIYINDPASTAADRIRNTWTLFAAQVKYLWTITVPDNFKSTTANPSTATAVYETSTEFLGKINTSSSNLNIRSAPSTAAPKIGSYKKGDLVQIISKTNTDWYQTEKGYISSKYVTDAVGIVSHCTKLNMRKEPTINSGNILRVLSANDELYLMKLSDNWYQVKTKDNVTGYVSQKYIAIL